MSVNQIINDDKIQSLTVSELNALSAEIQNLINKKLKGEMIKIWKVGNDCWDAFITTDYNLAKSYFLYMLEDTSEFDHMFDTQLMIESKMVPECDLEKLLEDFTWELSKAKENLK